MVFRQSGDTEREIVMASKQKQSQPEKWDAGDVWLHRLCLSFAPETGAGCGISGLEALLLFLCLSVFVCCRLCVQQQMKYMEIAGVICCVTLKGNYFTKNIDLHGWQY